MKTINESNIREMVAKALKKAIDEDYFNPLHEKKIDDSIAYPMNMLFQVLSKDEVRSLSDSNFDQSAPYFNTDGETFLQSLTPDKIKRLNNGYGAAQGKKMRIYKDSIAENYFDEYRTKGSLNKKTLEKNAGKSAEEIIADRKAKAEEDGFFNPEWEDSVDDILAKYKDTDETFDDTTINGNYKIDKQNPFFYNKNGQMEDADIIGDFHNDFAIIKKDGKCNYIDKDGKLLSDEWFDACNDFEDGFGMVRRETKRNYVRSNGELLLDMWVDRAGDFVGGTAPIIINGERHEIDRAGNIR